MVNKHNPKIKYQQQTLFFSLRAPNSKNKKQALCNPKHSWLALQRSWAVGNCVQIWLAVVDGSWRRKYGWQQPTVSDQHQSKGVSCVEVHNMGYKICGNSSSCHEWWWLAMVGDNGDNIRSVSTMVLLSCDLYNIISNDSYPKKINIVDRLQWWIPYNNLSPPWCIICKSAAQCSAHLFVHCAFATRFCHSFGGVWLVTE